MKRAVILHGTNGSPEGHWLPALKAKLEADGYEVWAPLLPENDTPNREIYNDFLLNGDWDFTDNLVVGHSSGAVEILNLLMDERCPHIKSGVLLGAWAGGIPNGYDEDSTQFVNLFPPQSFDFELIKSKADKLAFLHGDNDPYCPLEQAKYLAGELGAPLTVVAGGEHLGSTYTQPDELWRIVETI